MAVRRGSKSAIEQEGIDTFVESVGVLPFACFLLVMPELHLALIPLSSAFSNAPISPASLMF